MLRWMKRWLAYFLVPTGFVLLFAPLSTHRNETIGKDFVRLQISETLLTPAVPDEPSPPPDSTEDAWQQMKKRDEALSKQYSDTTPLTNAYGYPILQSEDMAPYPAMQAAVAEMMRRINLWPQDTLSEEQLDDVPAEEWAAFQDAHTDEGAFQFGNRIFRGRATPGYATLEVEVKHLRMSCRIAGGLFLLLGLFAMVGTYANPPPAEGIRIGKRSAMIVWDVATLLVGLGFAWWLVDFILEKTFPITPYWGEDFGIGMGIFWAVFMNPVVALIATALSLQTVKISRDEIVLKGLFGRAAVAWSGVESIHVSQLHSARKAGGVPAPHRVMKTLVIEGGGASLRIMEPPYASTKKEILAALLENAPDAHKPRIEVASKEWLSYL